MKGQYIPFNDGYGIVGYDYKCPQCGHETRFAFSDEGCEQCGFSEDYVDPDEWYDEQMKLPASERAWNQCPQLLDKPQENPK